MNRDWGDWVTTDGGEQVVDVYPEEDQLFWLAEARCSCLGATPDETCFGDGEA